MDISADLHRHTRINPVAPERRVKSITKLENGDLRVTQHSGETFDIAKEDELFQAYLIYMVLVEA